MPTVWGTALGLVRRYLILGSLHPSLDQHFSIISLSMTNSLLQGPNQGDLRTLARKHLAQNRACAYEACPTKIIKGYQV